VLQHYKLESYDELSRISTGVPYMLQETVRAASLLVSWAKLHRISREREGGGESISKHIYKVLSESFLTRSKKKCWLYLLNFGCHLLRNSLLGNVCKKHISRNIPHITIPSSNTEVTENNILAGFQKRS
jgi:hypothetical protein